MRSLGNFAWVAIGACIALIVAGCGDASSDSSTSATAVASTAAPNLASTDVVVSTPSPQTTSNPSPQSTTDTTESETAVSEPGSTNTGLQSLIDDAVADLVGRLSIDASAVTVLSASAVVWSDGSLGCPQPGMSYIQVTVDGTLIELSTGDTVYSYHSGGSRPQFLCETTFDATAVPPKNT